MKKIGAAMGKIRVVLDPEQREAYIDRLLELDGLAHIKEDPKAAYCPISLTSTPNELKEYVASRQKRLMDDILGQAGITAYDPGSAPLSPDRSLVSGPSVVYVTDSGKIVGARFFVGHNLLPSTGYGVEAEKAKTYNRISVIFMDKNIRVGRMQPHRAIYLQYENFDDQAEEFIPIFRMLQDYEPGMGFNDNIPVLLGFEKDSSGVVDLEERVYTEFPHLQYHFDGNVPIIRLRSENPKLFYEERQKPVETIFI